MNNLKYDTILFDLDGTLLNTLEDLYISTNYALNKFSYPLRSFEEVRCFVGNGVKVLIDKACPKNITNKEEVLETFKEYYKENGTKNIKIYDGIIELLKKLKESNIKIGVVTNKFQEAAIKIVDQYFKGYIDCVIGESKNISKKPSPDMCLKALEMLSSKAENTLYVGDSDVDIKTASNANLLCLSALWGFRTKEELLPYNPKIFINHPLDILDYLKDNDSY